MKSNSYNDEDVCIVGIGCVLPDASNPQEFWNNLMDSHCSIREIPSERWKSKLYFSSDKKSEDRSYSNVAAFVEKKQLKRICKKLKLDYLRYSRLQIMALEATTQAIDCLINPGTFSRAKKNVAIFLGCMEVDEAFSLERFYLHNKKSLEEYIAKNNIKNKKSILEEIRKYFNDSEFDTEMMTESVLTTSVIKSIKQRFDIEGEGALIDAACASSLAALDVAVANLKSRKVDLAITGGIESNLAPDTFVLFSKVGALSVDKCCPFDEGSTGLSQGEGASIFVLQRLADAIRDKNKIYGIVKSSGKSSDGKSSSLFSPSVRGQLLALERAYDGLDRRSVDYIECHGTGTKLGDTTELKSINTFFDSGRIPIGSVKSLIGHTKGAAGSCGMLKCILSLQNKKIPPSKYMETFIGSKDGTAYINREAIDLAGSDGALRFGISSFGFGNANCHVVLDEFDSSAIEILETGGNENLNTVVVLGGSQLSLNVVDIDRIASKFKILPQSMSHTDKVQLQSLLVVAEAFEEANIEINSLNREQVAVISASCLGLDAATDLVKRVRHFEFIDALDFLDESSLDLMIKHKDKFPKITEDTGPGVLNNVIAGRVCNVFDFNGENFNVDSDFNSFPAALNIATQKLQENDGVIVLIYCEEELLEDGSGVNRRGVSCLLLSTLGLAQRNKYQICEVIEKINYYESK